MVHDGLAKRHFFWLNGRPYALSYPIEEQDCTCSENEYLQNTSSHTYATLIPPQCPECSRYATRYATHYATRYGIHYATHLCFRMVSELPDNGELIHLFYPPFLHHTQFWVCYKDGLQWKIYIGESGAPLVTLSSHKIQKLISSYIEWGRRQPINSKTYIDIKNWCLMTS